MPVRRPRLRPRPPRHRHGGERTAERILDAAEELFAERGYNGTTLRDVATRVGVRPPSLYNHFASKDALYAAVLERGIGPLIELLARSAAAPAERAVRPGPARLRRDGDPRAAPGPAAPGAARDARRRPAPDADAAQLDRARPSSAPTSWSRRAPRRGAGARSRSRCWCSPCTTWWSATSRSRLFYRDLGGDELLGDAALEAQTRFLRELVGRLFGAGQSPGTPRGVR